MPSLGQLGPLLLPALAASESVAPGFFTTCFLGIACEINVTEHLLLNNFTPATVDGTVYFMQFTYCPSCKYIRVTPWLPTFQLKGTGILRLSANATMEPGQRQMCFCSTDQESDISEEKPTWTLGTVVHGGPSMWNDVECTRGWPSCQASLTGNMLQAGDRIRFLKTCGTAEGMTQEFLKASIGTVKKFPDDMLYSSRSIAELQNASSMVSQESGEYSICFCKPTAGLISRTLHFDDDSDSGSRPDVETDCDDPADFTVKCGTFFFAGPMDIGRQEASIGTGLSLSRIIGVHLKETDVIALQVDCAEPDVAISSAVTKKTRLAHSYNFPELKLDRFLARSYQLCWCHQDPSQGIYCNTSEQFRAPFGTVDLLCPADYVDDIGDGVCHHCSFLFLAPDMHRKHCVVSLTQSLLFLVCCIPGVLALYLLMSMIELSELRKGKLAARMTKLLDISPGVQGQTVVTTAQPISLRTYRHALPVKFHGTGHYALDGAGYGEFCLRTAGSNRLFFLEKKNGEKMFRVDTSMGWMQVSLASSVRNAVIRFVPVPRCLCALIGTVVSVLSLWAIGCKSLDFVLFAATVIVLATPLTVAVQAAPHVTSMERQIEQYRQHILEGNPQPRACPKGAGRAVTAARLFELLEIFQEFIKDRNMYYLDPNVVRPLTSLCRLSFSEFVGPCEVQWFVSHWWGMKFQSTCEALSRHAVTVSGNEDWKASTYWICTFSNNQYAIEEELGTSHEESSFYKALHCGHCRGTCMIIDEEARPLTRSWCLFELLQTIKLEETQNGFKGLLFCTTNGVLNEGACTVRVSMNIGKRLSQLRLEDADASSPEDKAMINKLVDREKGGFAEMNQKLRQRIADALKVCKEKMDLDYIDVLRKLGTHEELDQTLVDALAL